MTTRLMQGSEKRATEHGGRPLGLPLWGVLAVAAFVLAADLLYYPQTLEDAFITFRYSEHLAEGYGLGAWNMVGERVEGYTSFLWMLVLAGTKLLGVQIQTAAKWLGVLSHLLLVGLFLWAPALWRKRLGVENFSTLWHQDVYRICAIVIACYPPLAWYATSGMETAAFAFLFALTFIAVMTARSPGLPVTAAVLLVLTRPEGAVYAGVASLVWALSCRRASASWKRSLSVLAAVGVAGVGLTILRLAVFGEVVPNTYYAKAGGVSSLHIGFGIAYLREWAEVHWPFVVLGLPSLTAGCFLVYRKRVRVAEPLLLAWGMLLFHVAYTVKVGGDNASAFPFWRHLLHLFPLIATVASGGVVLLSRRRSWLRYLITSGVALLIGYQTLTFDKGNLKRQTDRSLKNYPSLSHREPSQYLLRLKQVIRPGDVVASSLGGELPYVVDAVHIDILGLNDRQIAHTGTFDPRGPVDSKTNMDSVLERRPDVIEGYVSAKRILRGLSLRHVVGYRSHMSIGLLTHPIFRAQYMLWVNGPYDAKDRALFLRRDYWELHPMRAELQTIPVERTNLYRF